LRKEEGNVVLADIGLLKEKYTVKRTDHRKGSIILKGDLRMTANTEK